MPHVKFLPSALIWDYHDSHFAGHLGLNKMQLSMQRTFWWPGVFSDMCVFVSLVKVASPLLAKLLDRCSLWTYPRGHGTVYLLTLSLVFLKPRQAMMLFLALLTDRPSMCTWFLQQQSALHRLGLTCSSNTASAITAFHWKSILTEGPHFAGTHNQALADRLKVTWKVATAFRPQSHGQTEHMHRTAEDTLRQFVSPIVTKWNELLVHAQCAINNAQHGSVQNNTLLPQSWPSPSSLGASLETGRGPPSKSKNPASSAFALQVQSIIARAYCCMLNAQQWQRPCYDKKHVPSVFELDSQVLLATASSHLPTIVTRTLIPSWLGPFKVLARVGQAAYRLELPGNMQQVHSVFRVSLINSTGGTGALSPPTT